MMHNKIEDLIRQLTLSEKIDMIHGCGLFTTKGIERLNIPPFKMSDGPMGVRHEFENDRWVAKKNVDDDTTYLPSGSAIASSWNRHLAYKYGTVLGEETRRRKKDMILAPGVNLIRTPLGGRNFEYLSEDPVLTSELAVPMVKGIQSKDVSSCVKHLVANNQEHNRMNVNTLIDENTLHDVYLKAFRACVIEADAYGLMGAYNKLDGEYCSQSQQLLDRIVRDQWGYEHLIVSDWYAVHDTKKAGLSSIDIEMSVYNNFDDYFMANPLKQLVEQGEINESQIDDKVRHILTVMDKLHMLDNQNKRYQAHVKRETLQQDTYEIAKESIVLLKNEDNVLPLSKDINRLLVIGDNAIRKHASKGGSAQVKATFEVTPLEGLKHQLGKHCDIHFAQGYLAHDEKDVQLASWQETSLESDHSEDEMTLALMNEQKRLRDEAVVLASQYEHVMIVGGLNRSHDTEKNDRKGYELPYEQDQLIQAVLEVNPKAIVYVLSGTAVNLTVASQAKTLVWSSYIGMHSGDALADVLFGNVNPSGKLNQTFAYQLSDYAAHMIGEYPGGDSVNYKEGAFVGYRHFLKHNIKPLFPFGYGLSYTTFQFKSVRLEQHGDTIDLHVTLKNEGTVDGKEVIQVYVKDEDGVYALQAFDKCMIPSLQTKTHTVQLLPKTWLRYDTKLKQFNVKKGVYHIAVGRASNDLWFETTITI